jgi:DNA polymerase III delta prime subunit
MNNYIYDPDHIHRMSNSQRIRLMRLFNWVEYDSAMKIIDNLKELFRKPRQPQMPNLLFTGDSGNGKTTIIRRFQELYGHYDNIDQGYEEEIDESVGWPVILISTLHRPSEKSLYISILQSFYVFYDPLKSPAELRGQVIHYCRYCYVEMLIFDEFHSLLNGSLDKQREVLNAIRLLGDELEIPIVGVGTQDAVRVLQADPLYASRFNKIALPRWEANQEFRRLLTDFMTYYLPLKKPSQFERPELVEILYILCNGKIGNLRPLLVECAIEAVTSGKEQIDETIILKVLESRCSSENNKKTALRAA